MGSRQGQREAQWVLVENKALHSVWNCIFLFPTVPGKPVISAAIYLLLLKPHLILALLWGEGLNHEIHIICAPAESAMKKRVSRIYFAKVQTQIATKLLYNIVCEVAHGTKWHL